MCSVEMLADTQDSRVRHNGSNSGELKDCCKSDDDGSDVEKPTEGCYIKARIVLTIMAFFARFNMYSMRSNLSVAIVAMVNYTSEHHESNSTQVCPDRGINEVESSSDGSFEWSTAQQGLALGCYYYGYLASNIPGGYLAKKYGIKFVLGISMLFSSVLTILSPLAAVIGFEVFVATRIMIGVLHGLVAPSLLTAFGYWGPPLEVTMMLAVSVSGNSVGTLLTLPLAGVIAQNLGWEAVFYVTGGIALPWSVLWLVIIYDKPSDHPRISDEEKSYIEKTTGIVKEERKLPTPWLAIAKSPPMWAIIAGQIASLWGTSIFLAMLPMYLTSVLRFNVAASGALSAAAYAFQFLVVLIMGHVSDYVRRRGIARTVTVRKANSFICLVLPAILMIAAGYSGCNAIAATSFFCLCVALSGCNATAHDINVVDIARRYSGICYGIVNTMSYIPGFLAPQVAGLILNNDQSITQWQKVFWVAAPISIVGFLIYLIFGSAQEQKWSKDQEKEDTDFKPLKSQEGVEEDADCSGDGEEFSPLEDNGMV